MLGFFGRVVGSLRGRRIGRILCGEIGRFLSNVVGRLFRRKVRLLRYIHMLGGK